MTVGIAGVRPQIKDSLPVRTRAMLEGPILGTLLRLAAPNLLFIVSQAVVSIGETYFVGWLGSEALAAVSLVFPVLMVMQTMSGGGIGSGMASAISRALGGGRRDEANALVLVCLIIAVCFGGFFTLAVLLGGGALFAAMGGTGEALDLANSYATMLFAGALVFWIFNTLGSILRGAGVMLLPALVSLIGATTILMLSPALIMGFGPMPRLGISGAALAILAYYAIGAVILGGFLLSGNAPVRLVTKGALRWDLARNVLRVGLPGALNSLVFNAAILLFTGLVGPFGNKAIAGYGIGARLEYLQIPIVFGLGMALITMVGTDVGAGLDQRGKRAAWIGATLAGFVSGAIGLLFAFAPRLWIEIFSSDPEIYSAASRYLEIVGPSYALYGVGLALYFAAQGAGRPMWNLAFGVSRLVLTGLGGAVAVFWFTGGLNLVYALMAAGLILFGGGSALSVHFASCREFEPAGPPAST
jgi:putative MATE family efflux protein